MRHPSNLGDLTAAEWESLQNQLERFEKTWRQANTVDLNPFLPPRGDRLRVVTLVEFIKTELEIRWRKGQKPLLEEYLQRYPELADAPQFLPHLIGEEYVVRQRHGDKPDLATYRSRFPEHFPAVQRLVEEQHATAAPPVPQTVAPGSIPVSSRGSVAPSVGGGYTLRNRLGAGTFGEVWRAEAPGGVDVAIKLISRPLDHADVQRELESLELIKRLRHPFLLQTQAFWSMEERMVIVMELADGSLTSRLKECQKEGLPGIPPDELIGYFREAAEALDFLHSQNVQHRDVKPDNILLLQRHAKVADFGLARLQEGIRMVQATACGTPAYMAPEVWMGKISRHSDQYSLAMTYAELRLGRPPFPVTNMVQMMEDHLKGQPNLEPLSQAEQEVILKAVAKDPDQRYANCREFCQALRQVLAAEGLTSPSNYSLRRPARDTQEQRSEGDYGSLVPTKQRPSGVKAAAIAEAPRGEADSSTAPPGTVPTFASRTAEALSDASRRRAVRRRLLVGVGILAVALLVLVFAWFSHLGGNESKKPPVDFLPEEYVPEEGAKIVLVSGDHKLYNRIAFVLPDVAKTRIGFVLITPVRETDPPPFYIMENKVSNKLFRAFAKQYPEAVRESRWVQGAEVGDTDLGSKDDRLPVFRVKLLEALQCAQWMKGELPTKRQWDKAAGCYEGAKGPFLGKPDDPLRPGDIAVGRDKEGPMPIGTATRDISTFGCRDMAGNGREWTSTIAHADPDQETGRVSVSTFDPGLKIRLRGHSYDADDPYQCDEAANTGQQPANIARPDISFRVVIEPSFLP